MMRFFILLCLLVVSGLPAAGSALRMTQVDVHERLFPDQSPRTTKVVVSVPRGAPVAFQFAVTSDSAGTADVTVSKISGGMFGPKFLGEVKMFSLLPVHVEGNTQGSKINRPGGPVPDGWMKHLVRAAPFDTLEVLSETSKILLRSNQTHGVMLEISVPTNAAPGEYRGNVSVKSGKKTAKAEFRFRVYETVLPQMQSLHSIHWLWPEPHNLSRDNIPEWWSERHWTLLENSAKQLRHFGDDVLYTPLVNYKESLIQIIAREDGGYNFDYTRFDRWIETFNKLGYRYFAGHHILNLPSVHAGGVFVLDAKTGQKKPLFSAAQREEWLNFLPTFYDSFHAHLKTKDWIDRVLLHQYDEPQDSALYQRLAALARKHLPGVRTLDAINSRRQDVFSPLVDLQVFNLPGLNAYQELAKTRANRGQGSWLYHCTSPYPPHPNRHIDCFLTESRLYPWLCFKFGAEGYLFWGANIYRGADEYKTSIGPFPNGSQNPGHPPGDNWFFYRSPDGLIPSTRMVSFREGMIDHALLTLLVKRNPEKAREITQRIARSITDFERRPEIYHQVRREILSALEK